MKKPENATKRRNNKHPDDFKESPKLTRIYLVSNCFENPNNVYVGKEKSHQTQSRKNKHKRTYGGESNFEYIDKVDGWSKQQWEPLETFWIKHFKDLGFELMNIRMKGGSGPEFFSDESRLMMSETRKGKNLKPLLQYNIEGKFMKEWESYLSTKIEFGGGSVSCCLRGRTKTAYGYRWKYKTKNYKLNIGELKPNKTPNHNKPILQRNLKGKLLKEWKSQTEIEKKLNIPLSDINNCLKKKQKTAHGYIWEYKCQMV